MSRKTALRLDHEPHERTARVPVTRRGRRKPSDGRLVGEVIAIAFDRCEAVADVACAGRPDALCTGCGTARCHAHGTGDDTIRTCTTCAAPLLSFTSAPFEDVLDTRLRLGTVLSF
jgi:hypothetical protein